MYKFDFNAWANEFLQQPTEPMSQENTRAFLNLLLAERAGDALPPVIKEQFLYQVIDGRSRAIGLEITDQTKAFLMFMTKNPGTAVMYLYALRSKFTSLDMSKLADVFPMGFLPEAALSKMWDKQKGFNNESKVDNCLDAYSFGA